MPSGVGIDAVSIDLGEFEVVDEGGIAGYFAFGIVVDTIAQIVGDIDLPTIAFVHVHEGCSDACYEVLLDTEEGGHIGCLVERVGAIALGEAIALWVLRGGNETTAEVDAHGVSKHGTKGICPLLELLDIDVVVGLAEIGLVVIAQGVGTDDFPTAVCIVRRYFCDGIDELLVALLPVVVLAFVFFFGTGDEAEGKGQQAKGDDDGWPLHVSSDWLVLFEFLQQAGDGHLVFDDAQEVGDVDTLLLHGVAETDGDGVVLK